MRQALAVFEQGLQATFLHRSPVHATPRYGTRGRPRHRAPPAQVVYHITGALTSSLTARQARIDQHSCFILATNELDDTQLPPQALLENYTGQVPAERGCRFVKDPQCFAASLYLKKPERIMALLMVMTVCLLVYAALEYRIRHARKVHQATLPDHKGKPVQHPTVRWVFHYFVGMHLLSVSGQWPLVLNLTEEHCNLLKLLGKPYMQLYGVKYSCKSTRACGMADKTLAQLRRWNTDSLQALDDAIHALLEERTRENAAPLPVKPDRTVVKTRRQGTVTQRLEYVRSGKASCHCAQDAGHGLY